MDNLVELPEVKSEKTPIEEEVLAKYFGGSNKKNTFSSAPMSSYIDWKTLGVATGISIFAGMPFLDNLFEKLPYGDNGLGQLAMRAVLFFVIFLGYMIWNKKNK